MDPREKEMLRKILELSEENNEMLKTMRRSMRLSMVFKTLYWIIILGTAVGAYYFIQPFLDQIGDVYGGFQSSVSNAQGVLDKATHLLGN